MKPLARQRIYYIYLQVITITSHKLPCDLSVRWQTCWLAYQIYYWVKVRTNKAFQTILFAACESLIFTQCSWQHDGSPQGGNLTVSQIFIVTLQMETLHYKLFLYCNATSLSFQMNSNVPTQWAFFPFFFFKGRKIKFIWFGLEVVYLSTLCNLRSKSCFSSFMQNWFSIMIPFNKVFMPVFIT